MKINYSDQDVIIGEKSIFLAGPTPRGENVISWRTDACQILEKLGFDGTIYVPEYSTWKPKESYVDQVMWERIALTNATVILFWVPRKLPDMAAFTTNVEFGYWLHSGKVIYGRPNDASKIKYLDWLYKIDYEKEPFDDLESLLKESIKLVDILYDKKLNQILPLKERNILRKLEDDRKN